MSDLICLMKYENRANRDKNRRSSSSFGQCYSYYNNCRSSNKRNRAKAKQSKMVTKIQRISAATLLYSNAAVGIANFKIIFSFDGIPLQYHTSTDWQDKFRLNNESNINGFVWKALRYPNKSHTEKKPESSFCVVNINFILLIFSP